MRISFQTQKLLLAIAGLVLVFLTAQIMLFHTFGILWQMWVCGAVISFIFYLFIYQVPQRRKWTLVYIYFLLAFAFFFAAFFLRRHPRALELLPMTTAILLIIFIAACLVAIFYPERRNSR